MKEILRAKYAFGTKENPLPFFTSEQWREISPHWKQVHGVQIAEIKGFGQACGEVDGMWTRAPDLPIAVVSADCIPVVLYREDLQAIAVLHAGWRGVMGHIVNRFFEALPAELAEPGEWHAILGPSIRACCYEFGQKEIEDFAIEFKSLKSSELCPTQGHLNILAPLMKELTDLGTGSIQVESECTYCAKTAEGAPLHFSYRRGDRLSRQFTIAILSKEMSKI